VFGYPNEVSQVLLNILNNAKDVLDDRAPARRLVRVRVESFETRQRISIADSGGGIPEDQLPKVFDPYFTTKGPGNGTGLGLFMCKTIVERNMGGRIFARNIELEPGVFGAEFVVEI
jgi:signal transduction histidine kinase